MIDEPTIGEDEPSYLFYRLKTDARTIVYQIIQ